MKPLKIKGYEVYETHNTFENSQSQYDITKNGKAIAHLREKPDYYSAYIIDAGGSINYDKRSCSQKSLLSFLTNVVNDIEDYYERSRCFI